MTDSDRGSKGGLPEVSLYTKFNEFFCIIFCNKNIQKRGGNVYSYFTDTMRGGVLSQHHVLTNELRGLCKKYSDHWFKPVRAKKQVFNIFRIESTIG